MLVVTILVLFLFVSSSTRAFLMSGVLEIFLVPRIPDHMRNLILLVLDVCLCLEEEGVQGSGHLNAHGFGKVGSRSKTLLQKIHFHS